MGLPRVDGEGAGEVAFRGFQRRGERHPVGLRGGERRLDAAGVHLGGPPHCQKLLHPRLLGLERRDALAVGIERPGVAEDPQVQRHRARDELLCLGGERRLRGGELRRPLGDLGLPGAAVPQLVAHLEGALDQRGVEVGDERR